MTRAAVTVFIETDHEGGPVDAAILFQQALHLALGGAELTTRARPGHQPVTITVHTVMEAGMAAGNGYLWLEPTSKAYPRKDDHDAE